MIEQLFLNNHLNKNHLSKMPFLMRVYKAGSTLGKEHWRQCLFYSHALNLLLNGIRFASG